MRFKNRYLLIQLLFSPPSLILPSLTSYDLYGHLRHALLVNFGEFIYGQCHPSLQVKYFNSHTNLAIIRSPRDDWEVVRAALTLIKEVGGQGCVVKVVYVGGTIRSCQKAAVRWTRAALVEVWRRKVQERQGRGGSEEVKQREAGVAKREVEGLMQTAQTELNQLEA